MDSLGIRQCDLWHSLSGVRGVRVLSRQILGYPDVDFRAVLGDLFQELANTEFRNRRRLNVSSKKTASHSICIRFRDDSPKARKLHSV
uniref:Uncharacterized protein n=1 Tax=Solibacter usitatus (strain Ellin6076) TaxID=234267 RepID=Q01RJ2_SOLUE